MTAVVHHGDALDVLRSLPAASVDAVVTSPPYAMQRAKQYGGVPEAEYPAWTVAWLDALRPALKPRASVLINIREHIRDGEMSDYVHRTRLAVRAAGWIECDALIWTKPDSPPVGHNGRPRRSWERVLWFSLVRQPHCAPKANGRPATEIGFNNRRAWMHGGNQRKRPFDAATIARCTDVISAPVGGVADGVRHEAAFPPAFAAWMARLITPPGGTVLDPFTGSGSTGVACLAEGFHFVGIEREAEYVEIARARLANAQQGPQQVALAI